jgi:UDP-N-acetylmuramoyl-tripeptide--D-alanyl-D-alanine ligase
MAVAAGMPFADAAAALSSAVAASPWRMELHERDDGLVVVNDAYNANPASMVAALDALAGIGGRRGRRTVAVLGEMKELGPGAHDSHRDVGRAAAAVGIDVVVVVGEEARGIAEGLDDSEDWTGTVVLTAGRDEAAAWVRKNADAEDVILVKASRGVALEVVADELLGGTTAP